MSPFIKPFDKDKYEKLMDGLECSEISLKSIELSLLRLEAEYYQKKYLEMDDKLKHFAQLSSYKKRIDCGPFGSNLLDSEYKESGVLVVRPFNLKQYTIENENLVYISQDTMQRNNLKTYNKGALLFSRVGDIKIGVSNRDNITISPNIIAAEFNDDSLSRYFVLFFHTKYGNLQIERQLKKLAQPTISTSIVSELRIPIFKDLIPIICKIYNQAEQLRQDGNMHYRSAEHLLINELELLDYYKSIETASVKSLSMTLHTSGRLDAEYYHPKYDYLFQKLNKLKTRKLGGKSGIVTIIKSIEPGSDAYGDEDIPFIRVSDVSKYGISEPEIRISKSIIPNIEKLFLKKDTILLSKDGSIGIAYKIREDREAITSSALLHLSIRNSVDVLPDYLTLIINSLIVQLQAERDSSGAIIQHWKPSDIENVIIPIIDMKVQKQISLKVQESFTLRNHSEKLLEAAKEAIEIAIEQGETTAIKWLIINAFME